MLAKLTLKTKSPAAFLCVGIIFFAAMAIASLTKANKALHAQAVAQMQSMRNIKKDTVVRYLPTIMDNLTYSEDQMIVTATANFASAFTDFQAKNNIFQFPIGALNTIMNERAGLEQTSTNTEMVASAAEELTATINEIAKNAENANCISNQAINQTWNISEVNQANDLHLIIFNNYSLDNSLPS